MRVMFDTNVYDWLVKNDTTLRVDGCEICCTHVQYDELMRTPDEAHRARLRNLFESLQAKLLPTQTAVWGDSTWGQTTWSANDGVYDGILQRLKELDGRDRGLNQSRDARIAEAAIKARCILVTNDPPLLRVIQEFEGEALSLADFMSR